MVADALGAGNVPTGNGAIGAGISNGQDGHKIDDGEPMEGGVGGGKRRGTGGSGKGGDGNDGGRVGGRNGYGTGLVVGSKAAGGGNKGSMP